MKNSITSSSKVLIITMVLFTLASGVSIAGGNDKVALKESHMNNSYSDSLIEMESALKIAKNINDSFEQAPSVKIYDSSFNLVKSAATTSDFNSEDKELLMLLRKSSVFMEYENVTYYLINE